MTINISQMGTLLITHHLCHHGSNLISSYPLTCLRASTLADTAARVILPNWAKGKTRSLATVHLTSRIYFNPSMATSHSGSWHHLFLFRYEWMVASYLDNALWGLRSVPSPLPLSLYLLLLFPLLTLPAFDLISCRTLPPQHRWLAVPSASGTVASSFGIHRAHSTFSVS